MQGVSIAARHKYGCRVLQRLLEHARHDQLNGLVDALLAKAIPLSRHYFATYVMQHILEAPQICHF